jgi:hypothetical protein
MAMSYTLTDDEVMLAVDKAVAIVGMDVARGWQMYFDPGTGESRLDVNIRGFAAEIAAARMTGLPLNEGVLTATYRRSQKPADIGRRVEVRSSLGPFLYGYRNDPITRCMALVTGDRFGPFEFQGWIEARDLQRPEHWKQPPQVRYAAWVVPANRLQPLPLPADV